MIRDRLRAGALTGLSASLKAITKTTMRSKLGRDPYFEHAMSQIIARDRLDLPRLELVDILGEAPPPVTIAAAPRGNWSSPVADMLAAARLVAAVQPRRALEIGSFRGYTALAMAAAMGSEGRLVTVDADPRHGSAYLDRPEADRIERRVGPAHEVLGGEQKESFDLIYLDADHRREAVEADTALARRLIASDGWLLWHDYANWGYLTGACAVPEVVGELAGQIPIVHLAGTNLALHRPAWLDEPGRRHLQEAIELSAATSPDPWETTAGRP